LAERRHSPSGSYSDRSGMDSTKGSRSSTSLADSGSDHGALSRRRRARGADKRPQRALVQEALRASRREQREHTVVDPRFKGLLSPELYILAQRGGRLRLPPGDSIRGIRADVKTLMRTSRQLAGDFPPGLVAFCENFQTAGDVSSLKEGTSVKLLHYFITNQVLGVFQPDHDTHTARQLTYKRAVRAILNEYLDGDDLVDHLQSLMRASQEKWEDEHALANRILDAKRSLGLVLQEAHYKVSHSRDSGGRSRRRDGTSTPRDGPSPSCESSLPRRAPPQ